MPRSRAHDRDLGMRKISMTTRVLAGGGIVFVGLFSAFLASRAPSHATSATPATSQVQPGVTPGDGGAGASVPNAPVDNAPIDNAPSTTRPYPRATRDRAARDDTPPMTAPVVASSTTVWYLSRAAGIATLVFLTASVLLGIATSYRWSTPAWPRFVIEFVHRNVSLLVVAFLAIHVVAVVADSFAPIGWKDVLIPFASPYRPIWLGLGTLACDLLLALTITSLLRHRIGFRTWRVVHWSAYLCWPLAVVHGLATGSDTSLGVALVITVVCVVAVVVATAMRITSGLVDHPGTRRVGFALWAAAPIVLAVWLASGPLASGWARRAGTPSSVLAASSATVATRGDSGASAIGTPTTGSSPASTAFPTSGFDARMTGSFRQSAPDAQGSVVVSLVGRLSDGAVGDIDVELHGTPAGGGGIQLSSGTVVLSGSTADDRYAGNVVGLRGDVIVADIANATGDRLEVTLSFTQLDARTNSMAGTMTARPTTSTGRTDGSRERDSGGDR